MNSELVKYIDLSHFVSSKRISHPFLPVGKLFVVENEDGEQGIFSCDTNQFVIPLKKGAVEFTPIIVPEHRRFLWRINFSTTGAIIIYDVHKSTETRYEDYERIIAVNFDILLIVRADSLVLTYLKTDTGDKTESVKIVSFTRTNPTRTFSPESVSIKQVEGGNVLIVTCLMKSLICVIDLISKTGVVMHGANYDSRHMPAVL